MIVFKCPRCHHRSPRDEVDGPTCPFCEHEERAVIEALERFPPVPFALPDEDDATVAELGAEWLRHERAVDELQFLRWAAARYLAVVTDMHRETDARERLLRRELADSLADPESHGAPPIDPTVVVDTIHTIVAQQHEGWRLALLVYLRSQFAPHLGQERGP